MTSSNSAPRAEDLFSVGARISWGAILGGSFVALAIYFMLAILGAAVGLSVSDRVNQTTIQTAAVVWGIVTLSAALFVGGLITSLFTVGENKVEAVFYGVIMWAFLLTLFLFLAATGVRAGASGMVGLSGVAQAASAPGWQATARDAGVPQDLIEEWRRKAAANADSAAR